MSDDDEEVEFQVEEVVRETDDAFLCSIDGDEYWIPKSQILSTEIESEGDSGTITIPEWLAVEKGLV